MSILHFLAANWDSVAVVAAFAAALIVLAAKKQYAVLDKIVLTLVVEAEKKYGNGTGALKLAAVIDWFYPRIPAVIRLFISAAQIERIIERVLAEAQKKWQANPALSDYIKS